MTIPVFISSDDEQQKFPSRQLNPADFVFTLPEPIELDGLGFEVCVLNVSIWNSVRNVVNQVFKYTIGGVSYTNAIPDGLYTIEKLNEILQGFLASIGSANEIIVQPNYNTNKVEVKIVTSTTSFTMQGRLAGLFGFAPLDIPSTVTVSGTGTHASPYVAQISDGIDTFQVRTDLHSQSYDGRGASDVLFQFTPTASEGAKIDVTPLHLIYSQVNKQTITAIRIRFTDQRGRVLDFNGEDTLVTLLIRPIK